MPVRLYCIEPFVDESGGKSFEPWSFDFGLGLSSFCNASVYFSSTWLVCCCSCVLLRRALDPAAWRTITSVDSTLISSILCFWGIYGLLSDCFSDYLSLTPLRRLTCVWVLGWRPRTSGRSAVTFFRSFPVDYWMSFEIYDPALDSFFVPNAAAVRYKMPLTLGPREFLDRFDRPSYIRRGLLLGTFEWTEPSRLSYYLIRVARSGSGFCFSFIYGIFSASESWSKKSRTSLFWLRWREGCPSF